MACDDCKWADWKRTKNGRFHPDKTGRCAFNWNPPPLPLAFSFTYTGKGDLPRPHGGYIWRGDENTNGCKCFEMRDSE